ncbi:MAG: lipoate--protein ligase family protein [Haloferacaceae archaeon]
MRPDAPALVVRGHAADPATDRAVAAALLDRAAERGQPAVRAWVPTRQVAFGPRDARAPGYDLACRAARRRGYRAVERRVGGRAVAYTGRTVAFARAVPVDDPGVGLDDRYEAIRGVVRDALCALGGAVERGEPPNAFCPGTRSLRACDGGKVAGLAQRVRGDAALVAGCVLVDDRAAQRAVLAPVYDALGVPFDPDAVGSLAAAGMNGGGSESGHGSGNGDVPEGGGPRTPARIARALESALVGDRPMRVERADRVAARRID